VDYEEIKPLIISPPPKTIKVTLDKHKELRLKDLDATQDEIASLYAMVGKKLEAINQLNIAAGGVENIQMTDYIEDMQNEKTTLLHKLDIMLKDTESTNVFDSSTIRHNLVENMQKWASICVRIQTKIQKAWHKADLDASKMSRSTRTLDFKYGEMSGTHRRSKSADKRKTVHVDSLKTDSIKSNNSSSAKAIRYSAHVNNKSKIKFTSSSLDSPTKINHSFSAGSPNSGDEETQKENIDQPNDQDEESNTNTLASSAKIMTSDDDEGSSSASDQQTFTKLNRIESSSSSSSRKSKTSSLTDNDDSMSESKKQKFRSSRKERAKAQTNMFGDVSVYGRLVQVGNEYVALHPKKYSTHIACALKSAAYKSKMQEIKPPAKVLLWEEEKSISVELVPTECFDSKIYSVRCLYPFHFKRLRELMSITEEDYLLSLGNSDVWDAQGGKSGSFAKTKDDRFVLKELSHNGLNGSTEFNCFMAMAPAYFGYLENIYYRQVPTALTKIVGVYTIGVKGKTSKSHVVVMENIFYNRKISRVFDLKGSLRGRYVEATEDADPSDTVVRLDQNLLEIMFTNPFYLDMENKALLGWTMCNDTAFLSTLNVMDYSLLVGVDEEKNELVIAIIDYIRMFTFDKKLEFYFKRLELKNKQKGPTVTPAKQYKQRFRDAIWHYFVMIPEKDCFLDCSQLKKDKKQNIQDEIRQT